jgi:hypothetical protein
VILRVFQVDGENGEVGVLVADDEMEAVLKAIAMSWLPPPTARGEIVARVRETWPVVSGAAEDAVIFGCACTQEEALELAVEFLNGLSPIAVPLSAIRMPNVLLGENGKIDTSRLGLAKWLEDAINASEETWVIAWDRDFDQAFDAVPDSEIDAWATKPTSMPGTKPPPRRTKLN